MQAEEILIPLGVFALVFGIVYIKSTTLHRQRMAMIEKGMDPATLDGGSGKHGSLRLGMLMAGIGLGLLIGWFADHVIFKEEWGENPMPYFIGVLLCGGGALIGHSRMMEKQRNDRG